MFDRRQLAKALTLLESSRPEDAGKIVALIDRIKPQTSHAWKIGVTGSPGAGKSTLIDALGDLLVQQGRRVAVLAIDPTSPVSGGSILGDKTRMRRLAANPSVYIRPQPTSSHLGGVARHTHESIWACEAAGYDTVIVETVGVGQSEVEVSGMVDVLLLVLAPAGGDELQAMKKGIVEVADIIVVNKADGDLKPAALACKRAYAHAGLKMPVLLASALQGDGIGELARSVRQLLK